MAAGPERRLVVFDCDGTLVDSGERITRIMAETFESYGLAAPDGAAVCRYIGLPLAEVIEKLLPNDPAAIRAIETGYRERFLSSAGRYGTEPLFDGVRECLSLLARRDNVILGIATGKSRRGLARILRDHALEEMFATLQTADDAPGKPHPEMLERAMSETGVTAASTVVIGDTSFDVEMARNAGALPIGVSWGNHPAPDLARAGAAHILDHMAELPGVIDHLWGVQE